MNTQADSRPRLGKSLDLSERVVPAWPGEICPCGVQARSVLVTAAGRLTTCLPMGELLRQVMQGVEWSRTNAGG